MKLLTLIQSVQFSCKTLHNLHIYLPPVEPGEMKMDRGSEETFDGSSYSRPVRKEKSND